jgi:hypothetical protein
VNRKPKLIGYWRRTSETGTSGASIIAYNNITAFKFPDRMQVYLTCNIEVSDTQLASAPVRKLHCVPE